MRRAPIIHREMTAAEAWEKGVCRRGVFAEAIRELWEPTIVDDDDDASSDSGATLNDSLRRRRRSTLDAKKLGILALNG